MWTAITNIFLGLWLMISPSVLQMNQSTANNNHIIGPLVITFSIISLWDINRKIMSVNIVLGAWLLVAIFVLNFSTALVLSSNGACACFIVLLSTIKRKPKQHYGGGWHSLFQRNPPHMREAEKISSQQ